MQQQQRVVLDEPGRSVAASAHNQLGRAAAGEKAAHRRLSAHSSAHLGREARVKGRLYTSRGAPLGGESAAGRAEGGGADACRGAVLGSKLPLVDAALAVPP